MEMLSAILFLTLAVVGITGQGQVPPGRRNPPFIVVPPENERIKTAASDRQEITVPAPTPPLFPEAPEVVLGPINNNDDDDVLTPFGPFAQPNFPQQPPEVVLPQQPQIVPQRPSLPLTQPTQALGPGLSASVDKLLDRRCFNCICQASTNCSKDLDTCVVTGPNKYFCGPYHISWAYWADSGKPGDVSGDPAAFERCLLDIDCAERSVLGYMTKFQRDCNRDNVVNCVDFAMIHKGGPSDCQSEWIKSSTYWRRFVACWGNSPQLDFRVGNFNHG